MLVQADALLTTDVVGRDPRGGGEEEREGASVCGWAWPPGREEFGSSGMFLLDQIIR